MKPNKFVMWTIVEAITTCLNHVVSACVMNQSRGHWLLFNALITIMNVTMTLEFQARSAC